MTTLPAKNDYTQNDLSALQQIAEYKWGTSFRCKNSKCRNDKYYAGKKPFSRRCTKCKKDESATANTVFDKLRMPPSAALELVKMSCQFPGNRYTLEQLQDHLLKELSVEVDQKNIWSFMLKVYSKMTIPKTVFSLFAIIMVFDGIIIARGIVNGKRRFIAVAGISLNEFINSYTKQSTCVWAIKLNRRREPEFFKVENRRMNEMMPKLENNIRVMFKDILKNRQHFGLKSKYAQTYLNSFCFIKNGGTYGALMKTVTADFKK